MTTTVQQTTTTTVAGANCVVSAGVTQTATTVTGTTADDTIDCGGTSPGKTINGFDGNDTITGTAFADTIDGGGGNDTVTGWCGRRVRRHHDDRHGSRHLHRPERRPGDLRRVRHGMAVVTREQGVHRCPSGVRPCVHALPVFGRRPLGSIRHSEIQAWVRGRSEVLAPGSVENAFRAVSAIFRSAVRDRLIAANPCEDVTLPRHLSTEVVPPTVEEVRTLLGAMPERYRVAGLLAAGAGLRQGEALGLTVDRLDFLRRQLRGHASAKVTLDTYGHIWPDSEDLTRRAIDAALGASVSPETLTRSAQ